MTFTGSASGFINAGNADAVSLGIAGNVETVGPWSTSFSFTPAQTYVLADLTFLAYAISGAGNHQTQTHAYQFSADINSSINLGTVEAVETAGTGGSTLVLDLAAGTTLFAGVPYTVSFTVAVGPNDPAVTGNNVGLGSITLNGVLVPEPGSFSLMLAGLMLLRIASRRNFGLND